VNMKEERKALLERLISSQVNVELLSAFHANPSLMENLEGLAARLGRSRDEVERALEELKRIGLVEEVKYYRLNLDRDKELQRMLIEPYRGLEEAGELSLRRDLSWGWKSWISFCPMGYLYPRLSSY